MSEEIVYKIKKVKSILIELGDKQLRLFVPPMDKMKPIFAMKKDDPSGLVDGYKGLIEGMGMDKEEVNKLTFFEANQIVEILTDLIKGI